MAVGRRTMVTILLAVMAAVVLVSLGAATAAAKKGENKSTTTASSLSGDSSTTTTTKPHPFGQTISSLRHEDDYTPAAVLMGKKVPGYYATSSTETTVSTEPSLPSEVSEAPLEEPAGSSDPSTTTTEKSHPFGQEVSTLRHEDDHTPAAVLMGKKVPGYNATTSTSEALPSTEATESASSASTDTSGSSASTVSTENGKGKVPAAVLKGKQVPGQSKK